MKNLANKIIYEDLTNFFINKIDIILLFLNTKKYEEIYINNKKYIAKYVSDMEKHYTYIVFQENIKEDFFNVVSNIYAFKFKESYFLNKKIYFLR